MMLGARERTGVWRRTWPTTNNGGADASVRSPIAPRTPSSSGAARGAGDCSTDSGDGDGNGDAGGFLLDRLIAMADTPGQLRAEALCLLTRIGRSYPSHLSGGSATGDVTEKFKKAGGGNDDDDDGDGDGDDCNSCRPQEKTVSARPQQRKQASIRRKRRTWESVSGLLLRCFADPDQNLRLHALKVLEALLLARAEQAAAGTENNIEESDARAQAAAEAKVPANTCSVVAPNAGGSSSGGSGAGGGLWGDLVQKHLQRALEDPYHGVRAVACSCHGCLLDSDWEAFSDGERVRCLDRLLAATRDRAAGKLLQRIQLGF